MAHKCTTFSKTRSFRYRLRLYQCNKINRFLRDFFRRNTSAGRSNSFRIISQAEKCSIILDGDYTRRPRWPSESSQGQSSNYTRFRSNPAVVQCLDSPQVYRLPPNDNVIWCSVSGVHHADTWVALYTFARWRTLVNVKHGKRVQLHWSQRCCDTFTPTCSAAIAVCHGKCICIDTSTIAVAGCKHVLCILRVIHGMFQ